MALSGIYPATLQGARYEETSTTALFETGACSIDNQGGQWVYGKASEALAAYQLSIISTAAVRLVQPAAAADIDAKVPMLCIPQVIVASGEFAWFWRGPGGGVGKGIKVLAATSCAQDVLLFATATDGVVDDAVVTDDCIAGLTICATITTAAAAECYATTLLAANLDEGIA
jgi:peptidoglycan biosynthesis protein MviN/MurJ (putative lipid II flippase)